MPDKPAPDAIPVPDKPEMPSPPPTDFPEIPKPERPETPYPTHPEPAPGKPGPDPPGPKDLSAPDRTAIDCLFSAFDDSGPRLASGGTFSARTAKCRPQPRTPIELPAWRNVSVFLDLVTRLRTVSLFADLHCTVIGVLDRPFRL